MNDVCVSLSLCVCVYTYTHTNYYKFELYKCASNTVDCNVEGVLFSVITQQKRLWISSC